MGELSLKEPRVLKMAGKEKDLEKDIEVSEENITGYSSINSSLPSTAEVDTEISKNLSNPATDTTTNATTDTAVATNTETICSTGSSNTASKEENSSRHKETSERQQLSSAGISLIKRYSDSSSSSSSSESDSDDDTATAQSLDHHNNDEDDTGDCNTYPAGCGNRKYGYPMIADEVDYRDLPPPPEDTAPSLSPSTSLSPIGCVLHTIEQLTIIESYPDQPTVDEGTHLWSDEREYIGEVRMISRFGC